MSRNIDAQPTATVSALRTTLPNQSTKTVWIGLVPLDSSQKDWLPRRWKVEEIAGYLYLEKERGSNDVTTLPLSPSDRSIG